MSIQVNRKYTYDELAQLRNDPSLAQRVFDGHVMRQDLDGTVKFVPWSQASEGGGTFGNKPDKPLRGFASTDEDPFDVASLPPIVKRTPHQRVDSMMLKVLADFKGGNVMTEEQIKANVDEVTAQAWRDGRTEITGEVVRQVIQRFMERAEAQAK